MKWPGLAALLGVLGFILRRWQMLTAFEPELGLCDPDAPACLAAIAFFILAAAAFLILSCNAPARTWREKDAWLSLWDQTFAARGDVIFLTLMVLAGVLTLASIPFLVREAVELASIREATGEGDSPVLQLVLALCAAPGGMAHILSARAAAKMEGGARKNGMLLFPTLLSCVWLLESYRANAADPVLWDYAPLLLAVALGLLFQMECASLAFGVGRPRRMLWLAGMTAAVSGAVIGGFPGRSVMLLLAGQALAALATLWIAPGHLSRPPRRDRFAPPAEEEGAPADGPDEQMVQDGEGPVPENGMEETTDGQQ